MSINQSDLYGNISLIEKIYKDTQKACIKNLFELLDIKDTNDYIIYKCRKIRASQIIEALTKD